MGWWISDEAKLLMVHPPAKVSSPEVLAAKFSNFASETSVRPSTSTDREISAAHVRVRAELNATHPSVYQGGGLGHRCLQLGHGRRPVPFQAHRSQGPRTRPPLIAETRHQHASHQSQRQLHSAPAASHRSCCGSAAPAAARLLFHDCCSAAQGMLRLLRQLPPPTLRRLRHGLRLRFGGCLSRRFARRGWARPVQRQC